jgi:biopolymer transport protein ExbB
MNIVRTLTVALILLPTAALAWWNKDWSQRTVVTLNTSAAGVSIAGTLTGVVVPIRLHSGNFDFVGAKPDGSDLRVVAGDDKTPVKFWIERFDSVNELAVLWVLVPNVLPATDKNTVYVYAGNDKAPADAASPGSAASVADAATIAAFHFSEKDGIAADQTGLIKASTAAAVEPNGLIGQSARLAGTPITVAPNDKLKLAADAPLTVSVWVRPDTPAGTLYAQGPLQIALAAGKVNAKLGPVSLNGGDVAAGTWSQVALSMGSGKITLYVNGAQAGQVDAPHPTPAIEGELRIGEGFQGLLDELDIFGNAQSADWIKFVYAAESADAKLIATKTETSESESSGGGSGSYFGILFKSLTPDAWVIIGILGVMLVIAVAVMIGKWLYIQRTDSANRQFLRQYRESLDLLKIGGENASTQFNGSSLYRLYDAGLRELVRRKVGQEGSVALSGASLDAVKASIDADSVREGYALNSKMVLLTIAIAGGPFLGLLGTVIGVMITFASIAAAGDVNVNAIAPGIAAALLATVAGLSVAIPSLFGYNYLASRIKTISSDMQIFVDEFVTRVAETYGAP